MRISDWSSDVCSSDLFRQTTVNNLFFSFVDWWGSLGPNPADTITVYPGTNIIKTRTVGDVFGFNSGDITKSKTDSFVYALNGQWEVGDSAQITADLAYQDSKTQSQFFARSEEHTSELKSLMRISYAAFCLKKKKY